MNEALSAGHMEGEQDRRISEAIRLEWARLGNFIRKRVADPGDAEDILQDVFYELIEASRLMKPIEHAGAWLFRVARNRITDRFRKKRVEGLRDPLGEAAGGDLLMLEDMLPSPEDFSKKVSLLGINDGDKVVVYDRQFGASAAGRVWWMFHVFGYENVALLDGGFNKGAKEKRPSDMSPTRPEKKVFTAKQANLALVRTLAQMKD